MTESPPLPVVETTAVCGHCAEKINETDFFCQACGFPVKGSDAEKKIFAYRQGFKKADDNADLNMLQKKIKTAGTTLYVLSGIFFLYVIALFFINKTSGNIATPVTYIVISFIFLLLGFGASKKPVASIISGLVLYILLLAQATIVNPASLLNGAFFKVIIIGYLIKGLRSALEAEKIKNQLSKGWK